MRETTARQQLNEWEDKQRGEYRVTGVVMCGDDKDHYYRLEPKSREAFLEQTQSRNRKNR